MNILLQSILGKYKGVFYRREYSKRTEILLSGDGRKKIFFFFFLLFITGKKKRKRRKPNRWHAICRLLQGYLQGHVAFRMNTLVTITLSLYFSRKLIRHSLLYCHFIFYFM